MIRENQQLLNRINVLTDGLIVLMMLPVAFWLRFYVLPGGIITVPFRSYIVVDIVFTAVLLFTYGAFGLYESHRRIPLRDELSQLLLASLLDLGLLLSWLFLGRGDHYSRWTLAIFFGLSVGTLGLKRIVLRRFLRSLRQRGYNLKHVLILGNGVMAKKYLEELTGDPELGYQVIGYVSSGKGRLGSKVKFLGTFDELGEILEAYAPDEVISAIDIEDYERTPQIIADCDRTGSKLSIVPFYAEYMSSRPQFDDLNGIPLLNVRRIPLDNLANAFVKRAVDILGSALILILFSPLMLICAVGTRLSSPGPVIFKQERVGRDKKPFTMYKFRTMRPNSGENTAWSTQEDDRRTRFGAFLRKCSLDEFPQFWNVLKGDMSLVGPRPELPFYVDRFKNEIPLYMVKHQVRPGITGWAQVNGFRGDTSIKGRIEHDIYYIENWTLRLDLQILLMTVFGGKFLNDEKL